MTYKGKRIDFQHPPADGVYALIEVQPLGRPAFWTLSETYGRTNLSGKPLARGWLGTTDDLCRDACGCVVVDRQKGKVRIRKTSDDALENPGTDNAV